MRYVFPFLLLLMTAAPASAADPSNLVATFRTDTQLHVQWQANDSTSFTLDYLDFGDDQPLCSDFPEHSNVFETPNDAEIIEGLRPSTWYHIHVHSLNSGTAAGSTNVIIVKTAPAGSAGETLTAGLSPDYIVCGGDGGGEETACAQVTFTLLPGSVALPDLQITIVDPPTGNAVDAGVVPIGAAVGVEAGSYHLRLGAPAGYKVTPAQRGLKVSCGDDLAVRVRFHRENP